MSLRFQHCLTFVLVYSMITLAPVYKAAAGGGTTLPTHAELTAALDAASAASVNNGAIFSPARMWATATRMIPQPRGTGVLVGSMYLVEGCRSTIKRQEWYSARLA